MNRKNFARGLGRWAGLPMAVLLVASSATAATVDLYARSFLKTMPDGTQVTMWGYSTAAVGGESSPGPVVTVPVGDTSLTINLHNELSEPTSIVIPGLATTLSPVVNVGGRVTSFVAETAPGGTSPYVWSSVKAGSYLYQSGTHPAVQVQMGLYGALQQDAAAGQAYPGQSYSGGQVLVFSEVDPALHLAVANGTYGTLPGPTSTLNYKPAYFLVNGAAYNNLTPPPPLLAADAGQTTLLRLLNAGLKTHVPALQNGYFQVVAEDGNPYTYTQGVTTVSSPRDQYSVFLAAGKTSDVLWTPTATGTYALYDRALHLTTGKSAGGMLVKLLVGGTSSPVANPDSYSPLEDQVFTVAAPGLLANDTPSGMTTAILVTNVAPASGTVAPFPGNGGFTFTPALNFNGAASFTYKANNGTDSNIATVSLNVTAVNDAPSFTAGANQTVTAGAGAQTVAGWATAISKGPANESAQTILPFVVSNNNNALFTAQPAVAANGTLTYTPVASIVVAATATVSVQAKDDGGILNGGVDTSAVQTFTITVNPVVAPGFPATAVLDNFNRANGALGANWIGNTAQTLFRVDGNETQVRGTGGYVFWNAAFGTSQEVYYTFTKVVPTATEQDVVLKVTGLAAGNLVGTGTSLIRVAYQASSSTVVVSTITPSLVVTVRGTLSGVSFANGDTFGARTNAAGSVTVYKNGVAVGAAVNTTIGGSGRIGVAFARTLGFAVPNDARFDNFGGGNAP